MTNEGLIRANEIKKELRELDYFIWSAEHVWEGKIIKQDTKYIFKSISYGVINSVEYKLNTSMKDKMLNILREHQEKLRVELSNI